MDTVSIKEAVDEARSEAQELHRRIEASTTKNHDAIRAELDNTAFKAKELAASVSPDCYRQHRT